MYKKRYIGWISLLIIIVGTTAFALSHRQPSVQHQNKKPPHTSSQNSVGDSPSAASDTGTSQKNTPATLSAAGTPTTECDPIFSLTQAKQILTANTIADSGNGTVEHNTDMTIKSCGYHTDDSTAVVVAHIATTPAGVSKNIVFFGSGRPTDTTLVANYGSAAFWQANTNMLNILSDNNWFTITCTKQGSSSLGNAKTVGTIIKL
jgi:hypothetical protein